METTLILPRLSRRSGSVGYATSTSIIVLCLAWVAVCATLVL